MYSLYNGAVSSDNGLVRVVLALLEMQSLYALDRSLSKIGTEVPSEMTWLSSSFAKTLLQSVLHKVKRCGGCKSRKLIGLWAPKVLTTIASSHSSQETLAILSFTVSYTHLTLPTIYSV